MHRHLLLQFTLAAYATCAVAQVNLAQATTSTCPDTNITVQANEPQDAVDMCRGAAAAVEFFRVHGQTSSAPTHLSVVDQLPSGGSAEAVGCFSRVDRRAYALSFKLLLERKVWLGLQVNRALYGSIAAHEVTHALTACNARDYPLSVQATEYIAFVAMLSAMSPTLRSQVLVQYPDADFTSEWDITEVAYGLDPIRFGVGAYRHFLREENKTSFIAAVMAGSALGPRPTY